MSNTKKYDNEYKRQALKLMHEVGCTEASKQLGISSDTLYYWERRVREGKINLGEDIKKEAGPMNLKDENRLLREQIAKMSKREAEMQEKIDFLQEASAFFAACHPKLRKMRGLNS